MVSLLSGKTPYETNHTFNVVEVNLLPKKCRKTRMFHKVPGYRDTLQWAENCNYFDPYHTSLALSVFYIHWYSSFGDLDDSVRLAINEMNIYWTENPIDLGNSIPYNLSGKRAKPGTRAWGLCRAEERSIFVYSRKPQMLRDKKRISKTSFIHELVHYSLYFSQGDADSDHEGDKYPGGTEQHTYFISGVNNSLQTLDL